MYADCDIKSTLDYNASAKDCWINYVMLVVTMSTLVLCTWKAGDFAYRFSWAAAWFWIPFAIFLVGLQIFADCSTDNVGISAVWSAFVGFVFLAKWRLHILWRKYGPAKSLATSVSLMAWVVVCTYYAVVESIMTTVAHLVAFGVGMIALLLFEILHQIPSTESEAVAMMMKR